MQSTAAIIEKKVISPRSQPMIEQANTASTVLIIRIPMWKW